MWLCFKKCASRRAAASISRSIPFLRLSNALDYLVAGYEEPAHVRFEKQSIGHSTQEAERRRIGEPILGQGNSPILAEVVVVHKAGIRPLNHCVLKMRGAIEGSDPTSQLLPNQKVFRPPSDFIP